MARHDIGRGRLFEGRKIAVPCHDSGVTNEVEAWSLARRFAIELGHAHWELTPTLGDRAYDLEKGKFGQVKSIHDVPTSGHPFSTQSGYHLVQYDEPDSSVENVDEWDLVVIDSDISDLSSLAGAIDDPTIYRHAQEQLPVDEHSL